MGGYVPKNSLSPGTSGSSLLDKSEFRQRATGSSSRAHSGDDGSAIDDLLPRSGYEGILKKEMFSGPVRTTKRLENAGSPAVTNQPVEISTPSSTPLSSRRLSNFQFKGQGGNRFKSQGETARFTYPLESVTSKDGVITRKDYKDLNFFMKVDEHNEVLEIKARQSSNTIGKFHFDEKSLSSLWRSPSNEIFCLEATELRSRVKNRFLFKLMGSCQKLAEVRFRGEPLKVMNTSEARQFDKGTRSRQSLISPPSPIGPNRDRIMEAEKRYMEKATTAEEHNGQGSSRLPALSHERPRRLSDLASRISFRDDFDDFEHRKESRRKSLSKYGKFLNETNRTPNAASSGDGGDMGHTETSSATPSTTPSATPDRSTTGRTTRVAKRAAENSIARAASDENGVDEDFSVEPSPESLARAQKEFGETYRHVFQDGKALDIDATDFQRLYEDEFLNDTLVNFFLKFLLDKYNVRHKREDIYLFNTFFYERLAQKDGYENVKKWTAKVNIFDKKFVIVPIHYNVHWYVVVIYNLPYLVEEAKARAANEGKSNGDEGVEIAVRATRNGVRRFVSTPKSRSPLDIEKSCTLFILDSLKTTSHTKAISNLRNYILSEAKDKLGLDVRRDLIERRLAVVPQQTNFCDCGIYMIHSVNQLLNRPHELVKLMATGRTSRPGPSLDEVWHTFRLPGCRSKYRQVLISLRDREKASENASGEVVDALDGKGAAEEEEDDDIVILDPPS